VLLLQVADLTLYTEMVMVSLLLLIAASTTRRSRSIGGTFTMKGRSSREP
jgi:hypothetical protein